MKLEQVVETAYRAKPETIASNDLLWVEVSKALCKRYGVKTIDDFFLHILGGQIPTSHSLAAAITNVRKNNPDLIPTEEQRRLKMVVKQRYINEYRNS
jgi:hypothetical protein